jgi:uncharacterized protein YycO
MKVYFCRSNSFYGALIRLFTFSRWNHVGIEIDGSVFDASASTGVMEWTFNDFVAQYSEIETVFIQGDNIRAKRFAKEHIGKPYDWGAIFALPFRTRWDSPDKWFCSEYVAAILNEAGVRKFRKRNHRITPDNLWMAL